MSEPADECVDLPSQATVVGRLARSDVRQRTELVGLRLTPEEWRLAERLAADAGVTVQELFRRAVSALSAPSEPARIGPTASTGANGDHPSGTNSPAPSEPVQDKPRVWAPARHRSPSVVEPDPEATP